MRRTPCIASDAPLDEVLRFAVTYNGYARLARDVGRLHDVVEPVLESLRERGAVPEWAGLDLLRGALFFLQRQTHHWGDVPPEEEAYMRTLVAAIAVVAADQSLDADLA